VKPALVGSTVSELEAGHLSMVSHPQEVADVIAEAAASVSL